MKSGKRRRGQSTAETVVLIGIVGVAVGTTVMIFPNAFKVLYVNTREVICAPF